MCKAGQVLSESAASVRDLYQDKHRLMGSHVSIESGHKATISAHQRRVGPPNPKSNRGLTLACSWMSCWNSTPLFSCTQIGKLSPAHSREKGYLVPCMTQDRQKRNLDTIPAGTCIALTASTRMPILYL